MRIFSRIYQGYCYLFYLDYLWQSKPGIRWGNPAISAACALAFVLIFNIISFIIFLQISLFGKSFLEFFIKDKLHGLIFVILPVIFLHNYIFLQNKKYNKIIHYYNIHPIDKKHGCVLHWIYIICSLTVFYLLIFLGILLGKHNLIPLIDHIHEFY